ncbi:MAG: gamma-glutamylcyclotransferase family protein [Chloroflexota bacterium]
MIDNLPFFVYGTLIPGQSSSTLWNRGITQSQDAYLTNSLLYSLGDFPMLIDSDQPDGISFLNYKSARVKGKLVMVDSLQYRAIVSELDRYEGYFPENEAESLYLRRRRWVTLDSGKQKLAWAYIGKITYTKDRPVVPGGDWISYIQAPASS